MTHLPKRIITVMLSAALLLTACACGSDSGVPKAEEYPYAVSLALANDSATIDGVTVEEFDYTWHCDPSVSHGEVDNAPAEYYTGTKPNTDAPVYIDHELYYFPELDADGFKLVNYDGEQEWAYYYTDGEHGDYIFATLPRLGASLPTQMMHSESEAAENKVLHITKAGTYILSGEWHGQIRIDLGDKDETFTDESAKVKLVLNGADITCDVAAGIVFYSLYECDNGWEDSDTHSEAVSTENAGATVIISDGSVNTVSGANIYRMLKTKYKDEDSTDAVKTQKKLRKTDGAFYSYVTMNIDGESKNDGKLTVNSGFEGIDSELHLSFNGGDITVNSQDDGINVNEDNVSVVTFNGGNVTLNPAQGEEGDGVDSNGYVVINEGTLSVNGVTPPDSAIDSEDGIHYNGGTVFIDGTEQSYTAGSVFKETGETGGKPEGGRMPDMNSDFDIKDFKEKVAALGDNATLDDVLALLGMNGGKPMQSGEQPQDGAPEPPEGQPNGNPPELPNGQQPQKP